MKVLLREDVSKLGRAGDLVQVADGYARNFLFPRELAFLATPENEKRVEADGRKRKARELARIDSLKELAALLKGRSVTIRARANEEQKLFGSVGAEEVAGALQAEHGAAVEPQHVVLDEPLRELGVFDVRISFGAGSDGNAIESSVKVWVVAHEDEDED